MNLYIFGVQTIKKESLHKYLLGASEFQTSVHMNKGENVEPIELFFTSINILGLNLRQIFTFRSWFKFSFVGG